MKNTTTIILLISIFTSYSLAQDFRIATYNIRLETTKDIGNEWSNRKNAICNLIAFHEFTAFGVQEAFYNQLEDIQNALPKYKYIGVGRDDGDQKGEHSAIFYDTTRFQLLSSDTFWLSENETKVPIKGWDATYPRVCTWGKFIDIKYNMKFIFMNTHFDHKGKIAQLESVNLILNKAKELSNDLPIIITGDLNFDEHSINYHNIVSSSLVQDTYTEASIVYEPNSTFNGWGEKISKQRRIDHIFVSLHFSVKKYGVLTDTYMGKYPSDHFPVMADLNWRSY